MTTINVSNLIFTLQQKINTTDNEKDILYYSKAIQQLRTANVYVVDTMSQLPSAALNPGLLYYVKLDEIVYFSNPLGWSPIYQTTATSLLSWGQNIRGQLGIGSSSFSSCSPVRELCSATDWCDVSAGSDHTAAIKTSGEIWAWGCNYCGRLGDGTVINRCSPVRELCSATDWCGVSAGLNHTAAIKTSGELWAWGCNGCGRLGDGTTISRCSPVREICSATDWCRAGSGNNHTVAIKTSGQIWSWGRNIYGQIGDGTQTDRCSPVREFCSATDWCFVSAGRYFNAAIKTSDQLWMWGYNSQGQLGLGNTINRCSPVREICGASDWCQASAGNAQTAAVKTSGELWLWGFNNRGQLGDGTTVDRCSPVREICSATDWCDVSAGFFNTAAVKTSGEIWAWGCNYCGRLGDGTTNDRCSPVREISSSADWCQVSSKGHTAGIRTRNL